MPGSRNAAYHIARVREDTGRHDTDSYANGYVSEGSTAQKVSILAKINEVVTGLLSTGFAAKYYTLNITNANYDYALPSLHLSEIFSVSIAGTRLHKDSLLGLDSANPSWRTRTGVTPDRYARYSNRIAFNATPAGNLAVSILANSTEDVPDLAEATDVIAILPYRFHDDIHYGASLLICLADANNPAAAGRIDFLQAKWNTYLSGLVKYVHEELGLDEIPPLTLERFYINTLGGDFAMAERKD